MLATFIIASISYADNEAWLSLGQKYCIGLELKYETWHLPDYWNDFIEIAYVLYFVSYLYAYNK